MKTKLEKYQIFIYLILVILIMSVIKIKYGESENDLKINNLKTTPTITISENKDYPLIKYLPYRGEGFEIDKYNSPMTLNLKLTTSNQQQAAKEISVWLESFGEGERVMF